MKERRSAIVENEFLTELREAIPFLKQIPNDIYFRLDISEFYLPVGKTARVRNELEERLGYYVMTYNADVFNLEVPVERHLCANVKGAKLTDKQFMTLCDYERKVRDRGVSLVAYQKPLELTPPEESELAKLYNEKELGHTANG